MTNYQYWQSFVASWGSLYCAAIFFAGIVFAFLPSRKRAYDEAANIPLRDD